MDGSALLLRYLDELGTTARSERFAVVGLALALVVLSSVAALLAIALQELSCTWLGVLSVAAGSSAWCVGWFGGRWYWARDRRRELFEAAREVLQRTDG